MIRPAYVFLLTGICCLLELLLRNIGLFFPFCALFVFYVSIAFGRPWGIAAACLGALSLDFIGTGAAHPWSALALIGIALLSELWLRRAEADSILMNFLPGLLIPPAVWLFSLLFFSQHFFSVVIEQFPSIFPVSVLSALCLPLMIFLLDSLNGKLQLPLFTDAKLKQKPRF